jgi:hypothetical protein
VASFKYSTFFKAARRLGVFLNLEAGATRNPDEHPAGGSPAEELEKARNQIAEQQRRLRNKDRRISQLQGTQGTASGKAAPERRLEDRNVVWIFGSSRTGSTWLASMLGSLEAFNLWNEPHVGRLFGSFYYTGSASKRRREDRNFIMGAPRDAWLRSIRHFVLEGAEAKFPKLGSGGCVVVKEPNGSIGAPLIMEALPESCMILLVRDPRDVVASSVDAFKEGGWGQQVLQKTGPDATADHTPNERVEMVAGKYLRSVGKSKEAYEAHPGPKTIVKYEELRGDPLGTMQRICEDLGMETGEGELARVVEEHSWENIPDEKKGEGKFYRKGTSGGWKDDLTPEQVAIVEEKTAPLLQELYPGE